MDESRLAQAARLGADVTLGAREDVAARIAELTGGRGVDVAFEVVGAAAPIATAMRALRKGGTLVLVGNLSPKVEVALQAVVTRELTLLGSCASCGEYPECIELMARGAVRRRAADHRDGAARGGPRLVRAPLRPRARPDEGHPAAMKRIGAGRLRSDRPDGGRHRRQPRAGAHSACALARAGADLVVTSRDAASCSGDRSAEIEALGRRAVPVELDVRDRDSIEAFAEAAFAAFPRIDILVNNAGCNIRKPAVEVTWDDWNLILDTNLRGTFFVAQAVARR